jgi:hypothetical protein
VIYHAYDDLTTQSEEGQTHVPWSLQKKITSNLPRYWCQQRLVFNYKVCPPGWSLTLGMKLAPKGDLCPLRGMFNPSFTPQERTLNCLEEWRDKQRISPPGDSFTPMGQNSLLRDNFVKVQRGQSFPVGAKLWMGLWSFITMPLICWTAAVHEAYIWKCFNLFSPSCKNIHGSGILITLVHVSRKNEVSFPYDELV